MIIYNRIPSVISNFIVWLWLKITNAPPSEIAVMLPSVFFSKQECKKDQPSKLKKENLMRSKN